MHHMQQRRAGPYRSALCGLPLGTQAGSTERDSSERAAPHCAALHRWRPCTAAGEYRRVDARLRPHLSDGAWRITHSIIASVFNDLEVCVHARRRT